MRISDWMSDVCSSDLQAATRGDGTVGEDVTPNVRTIADIPQRLNGDAPDIFEIRGEAYMAKADFAAPNERLPAAAADPEKAHQFPNPRNPAAGSPPQHDPRIPATRPPRSLAPRRRPARRTDERPVG